MNFESHIMPRLAKEYKDADKKKVPFDLDKIRNLGKDKGQTWQEIDFQDKINRLVTKGLIEDLKGGRYQISNLGIEWYVK